MAVTLEGVDWVMALTPEHALKEFLAEMEREQDWPLYDDFYIERMAKHPDPIVQRFATLYFENKPDDTDMLNAMYAVEEKYKEKSQ